MEVRTSRFYESGTKLFMSFSFPGDAISILFVAFFICHVFILSEPHWYHAVLVNTEILEIYSSLLAVFLIVNAEIRPILTMILIQNRMLIGFLVSEFDS